MTRLRHAGTIRCKKRSWMWNLPWYEVLISKYMNNTPVYLWQTFSLRQFAKVSVGMSKEDEANGPNLNTRLVTQ